MIMVILNFAAGLVRRGELVELSPPPAEIFVVVGEDTNNGTPLLPLAWCPHHQRRFSWLLVRTPTTELLFCRWPGVPTTSGDFRGCW